MQGQNPAYQQELLVFLNSILSQLQSRSMEAATTSISILPSLQAMPYATAAAVGGLFFLVFFINKFISNRRKRSSHLPPVPEVPGWPVIGNLLQLKEKKPHKTFKRWAETYGSIYSIKTGASPVIVPNSTDVAKEAMVSRYSSISTRKLTKALSILTQDKCCIVAMSDYGEFHKMIKRYKITSVTGPTAQASSWFYMNFQKRHRCHRDVMMDNISTCLLDHVKNQPQEAALGTDVESIYVPELGTTFSRKEIFRILVIDPMEGAIEVDWRKFFPYMAWVPNRSWEMKIERIHLRRLAVMDALIKEQKKRIAAGKELNCFLDFLLSEAKTLTEKQISMLLWETIIEAADTTLVTTEWAVYELAKNPYLQDRLYHHIRDACGTEVITEEHWPKLPFLNAVFQETIRKYSPAPVIPLRYVNEDTQLGGYYVPAGSQIAINIYGCNMDKNQWENPEEWNRERFLGEKYDPMDIHKTMAFGAGKRACAGALQALLIGSMAIGRLVQEFEWRLKDGERGRPLTQWDSHPASFIRYVSL